LRDCGKSGLRLRGLLRVKIQISRLKKPAGNHCQTDQSGTEQEKAGEKEKIARNCQPKVNYCQSNKKCANAYGCTRFASFAGSPCAYVSILDFSNVTNFRYSNKNELLLL
jgi:hypothetical protein